MASPLSTQKWKPFINLNQSNSRSLICSGLTSTAAPRVTAVPRVPKVRHTKRLELHLLRYWKGIQKKPGLPKLDFDQIGAGLLSGLIWNAGALVAL